MNYRKIYNSIISKRKLHVADGYCEKHHIIPKSLGGTDDNYNTVSLTAREHFICHYLLSKIYIRESCEWYKMNHAFKMMNASSTGQIRYFNSRLYKKLREDLSKIMSFTQKGSRNSNYGMMWISSDKLKQNRCVPKDTIIPDGWIAGRNVWNWFDECSVCGNKKLKTLKACSHKCKSYMRSPHVMIIDENLNSIIEEFKITGSIVKTLELFGVPQDTRRGNTYLSRILKEKGFEVLKRRNTAL